MKFPSGLDAVTQLEKEKAGTAKTTKSTITVNFTATMTSFTREDSRMPITSRMVIATTIAIAGTFRIAPVDDQVWLSASKSSGAETNCAGMLIPRSLAKLTT